MEQEQSGLADHLPQHLPVMLRVATALVGRADAEDATQEAILRAWQAWPALRDVGAVRPWLLRITVNVCRGWRRGAFGRWQQSVEPLTEAVADRFARLEDDPGGSAHAEALDLRHAINQLPDELRVILVLRYYGGMDSSEIGQALDAPAATVRTRLRRAMEALRAQLRDPHAGDANRDAPDLHTRAAAATPSSEESARVRPHR